MIIDVQKNGVNHSSFSDSSCNVSFSNETSLFDTRFETKEIKEFEFSESKLESLIKTKKKSRLKSFVNKITGKKNKEKEELIKKFENNKISFINNLFNFNDSNLFFTNFNVKEFFTNHSNKMSDKKTMIFNRKDFCLSMPNEQLSKNVINEFSNPLDFSQRFLTNPKYQGFDFKGKIISFDRVDGSNDYQTKKVVIYLIPGKDNHKNLFYTFSLLNFEESKMFESNYSRESSKESTFSGSDVEKLDELDNDYIDYDFPFPDIYGARPSLG